MSTTYTVYQGNNALERHNRPQDAFRVWLILRAHEKNNGRSGQDLTIIPPVCCYLDDVYPPLPPWVEEALGSWYINLLKRPPDLSCSSCFSGLATYYMYDPVHDPGAAHADYFCTGCRTWKESKGMVVDKFRVSEIDGSRPWWCSTARWYPMNQ